MPTSSITNLRDHLRRLHAKDYVAKCTENEWPIMIKGLAPPPTQMSIEQSEQIDIEPRPKFSPSALASALVNWIVVDDQVSVLMLKLTFTPLNMAHSPSMWLNHVNSAISSSYVARTWSTKIFHIAVGYERGS